MIDSASDNTGLFIPPEECNGYQLMFLTIVYGYILFTASNLISDGSELLLLVPSLSGLVGSVVLPILGAIPDGMMVLFSGLGSNAQEEVAVGVGALAGSTIMLLTVPWFLSIFSGRVSLYGGEPMYKRPRDWPPSAPWSKLLEDDSLAIFLTGIKVGPQIKGNASFMMISCMAYLIIQVPACIQPSDSSDAKIAKRESFYALIGCFSCLILFVLYLVLQYRASCKNESPLEEIVNHKRVTAIKHGQVNLRGAMASLLDQEEIRNSLSCPMLEIGPGKLRQMKKCLQPFFHIYDVNHDHMIDIEEFRYLLRDMHETGMGNGEQERLFRETDTDNSGMIDFDEFVNMMIIYVREYSSIVDVQNAIIPKGSRMALGSPMHSVNGSEENATEMNDDEEEEEEIPEDLAGLTPEQQQRRIKLRAAWMLAIGAGLILIFSEPAVSVLGEIAARTGIHAFYVSFILAPLASNASELIAAFNYAQKKSKKTITIALTTLQGAACMNNTFCLGIFLALVYFKALMWTFSAETISIIFVEICVGILSLRSIHTLFHGFLVLSLYPLSLLLVFVLESSGVS